MKNTKNINPIEIAFYSFVTSFPESFHPCDRERFYTFVRTLMKYKKEGNKWFNKKYFIERFSQFMSLDNCEIYYAKFETINDYLTLGPTCVNKVIRHQFSDNVGYINEIKYVKNGELIIMKTDIDTFNKTNSLKSAEKIHKGTK